MSIKNLFVTAAVTGKRQITLPKEVSERLKINNGDRVIFREKDGAIVFEKDELSNECSMKVTNSYKYNFIIPFHHLSDALRLNDLLLIDGIFQTAEEVIDKGGKTIIQKEYTNAEPQIMRVIDSVDELKSVKQSFLETNNSITGSV